MFQLKTSKISSVIVQNDPWNYKGSEPQGPVSQLIEFVCLFQRFGICLYPYEIHCHRDMSEEASGTFLLSSKEFYLFISIFFLISLVIIHLVMRFEMGSHYMVGWFVGISGLKVGLWVGGQVACLLYGTKFVTVTTSTDFNRLKRTSNIDV